MTAVFKHIMNSLREVPLRCRVYQFPRCKRDTYNTLYRAPPIITMAMLPTIIYRNRQRSLSPGSYAISQTPSNGPICSCMDPCRSDATRNRPKQKTNMFQQKTKQQITIDLHRGWPGNTNKTHVYNVYTSFVHILRPFQQAHCTWDNI